MHCFDWMKNYVAKRIVILMIMEHIACGSYDTLDI